MATKRRGSGSLLGISQSASKRRKTKQDKAHQQKVHRVNLADANDEFQTLRQQCGFKKSKPAEFVKHLMTVHNKYCSLCVPKKTSTSSTTCTSSSSTTTRPSTSTFRDQDQGSFLPEYSTRSFSDQDFVASTPIKSTSAKRLFGLLSPDHADTTSEPSSQSTAAKQDDQMTGPHLDQNHEGVQISDSCLNQSMEEEVLDFILDETISDDDDDCQEEGEKSEFSNFSFEELGRLTKDKKFVTYSSQLMPLVKLAHGITCKRKGCKLPLSYCSKSIGSAMLFTWKCSGGHTGGSWYSQPWYHRMLAGNLQLAASLLISGNSYTKVALMFKFAGIAFISNDTFNRVQKMYVVPAVEEYWDEMQHEMFSRLTTETEIHLVGDGRNDSPGYSSQFCTYTLSNAVTKEIIHMEMIDSREVDGKSVNMELLGFERAMKRVMKEDIKIKEITTDAHSSISAKLRHSEKYQEITHNWDMWHGGKNVYKKALEVAGQKGNGAILPWADAIRSHLWYACKKCNGNQEVLKAIWVSYIHHCVNEHSWIVDDGLTSGECEHGCLEEEGRTRPWLKKDSQEHKALRELIFAPRLMKTLHYYANFRHTGFLESFHNHLLMYVPKRHSYSCVGYKIRNLLAAIDCNKHLNRPQQVGPDGKPKFVKRYSKRSKKWTAQPKPKPKTYSYIPDLMERIVAKRLVVFGHLSQHVTLSDDDPRRISSTIAKVPAPSLEKLVQDRLDRMNKS